MERDHCTSADSNQRFTTSNYGITTTAAIEYWYVVDPEAGRQRLHLGEWPGEVRGFVAGHQREASNPRPLASFTSELQRVNGDLKAIHEPTLLEDELVAGRLYTGPMFHK